MKGTEKQVAWAEKIKAAKMADIERLKAHPVLGKRFADPESDEARALAVLVAADDAADWIRWNHNSGSELLHGKIAALKLRANA